MTQNAKPDIQIGTVESDPSIYVEVTKNGPYIVHGAPPLHVEVITPNPGSSGSAKWNLLAPFAAVAAIGFGIGAVQRRRLVRSIPAQVSVDSQGIRIDGVGMPYAQLARIWLTPPAYPVKRLRFDRAAGKTTTHLLASSRVGITPDYGDLLLAVRARTAHLPGLLSLDLE